MNATINSLWGKYKVELFTFGAGVLVGIAILLLVAHAFGSGNDTKLRQQSDQYYADYTASQKLIAQRDATIAELQKSVDGFRKQAESLTAIADGLRADNNKLDGTNKQLEASVAELNKSNSTASSAIGQGIDELQSINRTTGQLENDIQSAAALLGKADDGLQQLQGDGSNHH